MVGSSRGVRLVPGGLEIGGEVVPLIAGSVHYWRLDPRDWRACLEATKALGVRFVDAYIPWGVHEIAPGQLELGRGDPQRDVGAFFRLAHELGLYVIARPGPHINAELTYFGIPERVVWDPACQAKSPRNNPVMLPMLPFAFPVPSYASDAFHDEVARYFRLLGPTLAPLLYPDGPIALVQIDNEGAFYFRDGAYDQDYHPDAIALYRAFLRKKYGSLEALQAAYPRRPTLQQSAGAEAETKAETEAPATSEAPPRPDEGAPPPAADEGELVFASLTPPARFDAEAPQDLARHLDWAEFHEHLLETAFERFARALEAAGIEGLPTSHNLPPGQDATPLNAARVKRSVDLVGLDYYHAANAASRTIIARRTSELAVRCEGLGHPAFACEMGAGFPPFFPPLEERDSAFTVMAALAYGLRGFNVYMAVERDRWINAPIDPHGRARPFAAFWRKLCAALEATSFGALRRRAEVRILTPRSERRLARVMHAFGPITGAFFSVLGLGARESVSEHDLGLGHPIGIEAGTFARAFEEALDARGVPFAHVGGEDRDVSLEGAKWIICASAGSIHPELFRRLEQEAAAGALITIGPRAPAFDGSMRPLVEPLDPARLRGAHPGDPLFASDDPAAVDAAVARAIEQLSLPTYACAPDGVFATVHEDAAGRARVVFLLNPGEGDVVAKVTVNVGAASGPHTPSGAFAGRAVDLLDDATFPARGGALEVRMKPRTVRMLGLRDPG